MDRCKYLAVQMEGGSGLFSLELDSELELVLNKIYWYQDVACTAAGCGPGRDPCRSQTIVSWLASRQEGPPAIKWHPTCSLVG